MLLRRRRSRHGRAGRDVRTAGAASVVAFAFALALSSCASGNPDPNAAPIPASVRVDRDLTFASPGGTALRLDACTPRAAKADLPVVVLVHGGSWDSGSHEDLAWLCAEGAEHGFAAFTVDYRLLPAAFPDQLEDVASAIAWVKSSGARFHADPTRITLLGASAGGSIVAQLLTGVPGSPLHPSTFRGGAMLSAAFDLPALRSSVGVEAAAPLLRYAGCSASADCGSTLAALSAVRAVDADDPPMFLTNSTGELTPSAQPERMAAALASAGVRHRLIWSKGGNHAEEIVFADRSIDAALWSFLRSTVSR